MDFDKAHSIALKALATGLEGKKLSTCSYGRIGMTESGKEFHSASIGSACHLGLQSGWSKDYQFYYSTLASSTIPSRDPSFVRFYGEQLISEDGSYQKLTKGRQSVLLEDKGVVLGYLISIQPDDSIQLINHMSVVGRVPQEYFGSVSLMRELMELGVPGPEARFIALHFSPGTPGTYYSQGSVGMGHTIIDAYGAGRNFKLKAYSEGEPSGKLTPVTERSISRGINQIFYETVPANKYITNFSKEIKNTTLKSRWCEITKGSDAKRILEHWNESTRPKYFPEAA